MKRQLAADQFQDEGHGEEKDGGGENAPQSR
jgi:hypothetical protein